MPKADRRLVSIRELLAEAERTGKLDLASQPLSELPPEIGQLTRLQKLTVGARLTRLPPEIGQLTGLRTLSLSHSRLTELPPEIGRLASLLKLDLTSTKITMLPPEIGELKTLQSLSLGGSSLAVLPPEIGQLAALQGLDLGGTRVSMLPPEIGQLTGLQTLSLGGTPLTMLPPEIGQLTGLRSLMLDGSQLTQLPPEIAQLTSLRTLSLVHSRLTELPPEIGQLTGLQTLTLGGNVLAELPPEIGQLTNLERLGLDNFNLTELPSHICRLTGLQTLSLAGNGLIALPPEIGQLTSLQRLGLGGNRLAELPPAIGQLTGLQVLDLGGNQLTALPQQLAELLAAGLHLNLGGNPLPEPLPELIERGAEALASYLRSLEDAVQRYEAKVLLLGEGNVGKTSLVAALASDPFVEDRPTTHGIEVNILLLSHPDIEPDMTVRIWDFGGQEVYRVTHQFFFSRRALYLVVWKAREGQEQNEVEGWLRRIRLRVSRDARVLIVATHCDERRPELDYPSLKSAFPELLVGQSEVDNRSGHGIVELREAIAAEAARLPVMGQMISARWIVARDAIVVLADSEPQIPYERFASICRAHGVDGSEILTLAELMHDLGQIIYYGDDDGLRDFVILNPEWLTKAISYVLEDERTRRSGGILDHNHLREIWEERPDGSAYPTIYHPYFLRLMEKFDISYRLQDDQSRSLVAQLVPHDRPGLPWDVGTPLADGIRRMTLVCQLSEPAPGLVAWLTVQHHRSSTGRYWRRGVFLRYPITRYASEALIELLTPRQLAIDVRAPSPDFFFNVLRDSVEDLITRRWPGLTYLLAVPCPGMLPNGSGCSGQFSLEGLQRYRERGGTTFPCLECGNDHDLSRLLTGFAQPDMPFQLELDRMQEQLAEITGGVQRVEAYAAETADAMRRVLRALSSEITDCPLLFTLTEQTQTGLRRIRVDQKRYELVLWCEHPGHWHPWPAASYALDQPKDWLVHIAPYASLILKILKLAVPLAGPAAGVVLTDQELQNAQHQLDLMTAVVAELPGQPPTPLLGISVEDQDQLIDRESGRQLTTAEGQAARALRLLIFDHDRARAFGDLRRVQTPSGDFLWVCTDHYTEYDPGLPVIAESAP